jgi:hypothetical protein
MLPCVVGAEKELLNAEVVVPYPSLAESCFRAEE